ncbi:MAG: single-stranded DNA-binding protein [Ideonella sp.]|nr:single-stranded DNA-binding protein [Ideonella sp.]
MSLHLFAAGELIRDPERRTSAKGADYVTALLKAGEELLNLSAFDAALADRLAALRKGAALACSGRLQARPYTDRDGTTLRAGLGVVVSELMTGSLPPAKASPKPRRDRSQAPVGAGAGSAPFDDALPEF